MKAKTRALLALVMSLGLTAGLFPSLAHADPTDPAPPDPIWTSGSSFNCQQGVSTVSECAYYVVTRLVGTTDPNGCIYKDQAPEYCDRIASDEHTWLWQPVTTWDIAQAVLRGYERVTQDPAFVGSGFWEEYADSLYTAAQARVASLFDPVTHEYLGVVSDFTRTHAPSTSGHVVVGGTLTAKISPKSWSPKVTGKAWQWQRNGVDIAGATSDKYKLVADDLGTTITVKLTGSRDGYNSVTTTSKPTKTVGLGTMSWSTPKITGSRHIGVTLNARTKGLPASAVVTCQWYRNGMFLEGATACGYTLSPVDLKFRMRVVVSAKAPGYFDSMKASKRTGKILKGIPTKGTVTITGIPQVGQVLTVNPGTWGPDGVTLTCQWYRGRHKISGATGTSYTLVAKDKGQKIRVKVTGVAPYYYAAYKYSAWTIKVAPLPPVPPVDPGTP